MAEISVEEMENFAKEHGIPALLDHLGLDGLANEVNEIVAKRDSQREEWVKACNALDVMRASRDVAINALEQIAEPGSRVSGREIARDALVKLNPSSEVAARCPSCGLACCTLGECCYGEGCPPLAAEAAPEPDHFEGNIGANIAGGYLPAEAAPVNPDYGTSGRFHPEPSWGKDKHGNS
jgi:hypothetical protein